MCYCETNNEEHPPISRPALVGANFPGRFSRNPQERRDFHARAVAEKTRYRSKKSSAGMSRKAGKTPSRASRRASPTRAITRSRVGANKRPHRRKPEAGGATLGMNAKKTTQRQGFKTNEFIVYPAHGVGQIISIEEQEV